MKRYRLKISENDYELLKKYVLQDIPLEAGAFALAGISENNDVIDILVRRPIEIPKNMMVVQEEYHLELSTSAINGLIALCDANKLGVVFCHSHLDGLRYSPSDDYGENRLANTLRKFIPKKAPIASLLFSNDDITGRVWVPGSTKPVKLTEIIIIGHNIRRIPSVPVENNSQIDLKYDRQVRAFGTNGQKIISQTKVGIVGLGGTGSPVAEQLVRLGVNDFVLIDPDTIDYSNLTRVYGIFDSDINKAKRRFEFKVNVIKRHLVKINPSIKVNAIPKNVVFTTVARELFDRDVIFLCTDEHWGRAIVNQISYQYMIPAINIGARISSSDGSITHANGVIDVLRPDNPCLWCKQYLKSERIAAESIPHNHRKNLIDEGYVENLNIKTPSVISLTSTIASLSVSIFMHMVTNFMGETGNIQRLNYDMLIENIWRGQTAIDEKCICKNFKAFGDLMLLSTIS